MRRFSVVVAATLLAASPASAATRHATPAPAAGANCSQANPCALTTALSGAANGDTVKIGSGTYGSASARLKLDLLGDIYNFDDTVTPINSLVGVVQGCGAINQTNPVVAAPVHRDADDYRQGAGAPTRAKIQIVLAAAFTGADGTVLTQEIVINLRRLKR